MNFFALISENMPILCGFFSLLGAITASIVEHLLYIAHNKNDVKLKINNKEIILNATNEKELLDLIKKINGEQMKEDDDQINIVEKKE